MSNYYIAGVAIWTVVRIRTWQASWTRATRINERDVMFLCDNVLFLLIQL